MLKKISSIIAIGALVLVPVVALGQTSDFIDPTSAVIGESGVTGIYALLGEISTWMLNILILVAVIFFVYAGFLYLTSGGEEEKVKKAKNSVIYGLIAIAIGLLAKGLIALVASLAGGGAGNTGF